MPGRGQSLNAVTPLISPPGSPVLLERPLAQADHVALRQGWLCAHHHLRAHRTQPVWPLAPDLWPQWSQWLRDSTPLLLSE